MIIVNGEGLILIVIAVAVAVAVIGEEGFVNYLIVSLFCGLGGVQ